MSWDDWVDLHREVVEIAIAELVRENGAAPDSPEGRELAEMYRQEANSPRPVARTALESDGQLLDAYDDTLYRSAPRAPGNTVKGDRVEQCSAWASGHHDLERGQCR
jgi:hypothetical protein